VIPVSLRIPIRFPAILLGALTLAIIAGCSNESGPRIKNLAPSIRITGGPPEDREDSYAVRLWWTGWDSDGSIDHYEYTIDPPPEFTSQEIASPENSPGLSLERVLGPDAGTDTLRFSKVVDGDVSTFDYVQTPNFTREFLFDTPHADTGTVGGIPGPLPRFSGAHRIYVRCRDNEDAYSPPDQLGYTAVTITPSARLTAPRSTSSFRILGSQITLQWSGEDLDSPDASRLPVGYFWKLVKLNDLDPPINILQTQSPHFIMYQASDHLPWTYISAETTSIGFNLDPPASYMFAVRAVDVAGAVEPFLDKLRAGGEAGNVIAFVSLPQGGFPELTITEPSLGTFNCRGQGGETIQVPVGLPLRFRWTASAEAYGGEIEAFNWGVDIKDISRDGPNSGWRGWTKIDHNLEPVSFRTAGTHTIYIKVRDKGGQETICALILDVLDFPFDREILIVDDYKDAIWPRDHEHDAFWDRLLEGSGRFTDLSPEVVHYESFGPDDALFFVPEPPELELLGRYQAIVWNVQGGGNGGATALLTSGPIRRHLGAYMLTGGKLWVTGQQTLAAMTPTATELADFTNPRELEPTHFAWQFFKIFSADVRNVGFDRTDRDGMWGVATWHDNGILPPMELDEEKRRPFLRGKFGVGASDAIFDPIFDVADPRFRGVIDSLYSYRAFGSRLSPPKNLTFNNKLCALRFHDPNPNWEQSRNVWFGFPLYYLREEQVQETFNRIIDWFREEPIAPPEEDL